MPTARAAPRWGSAMFFVGMLGWAGIATSATTTSAATNRAVDRGQATFQTRCSECHTPPKPATHTAKQWEMIVDRMQGRRVMSGFSPLSKEEMRLILDYLQRHAAVALPK